MNAITIKNRIEEMQSHFTFMYNGHECGIDPISINRYDMWYGDAFQTVTTVDDAMNSPFFGGNALKDIASSIDVIDF